MPQKSIGFAVGNVRARENSLLTKQNMLQLAAMGSLEEMAAFLRDKGYPDPRGNGEVSAMLRQESEALWQYIFEVAPDRACFDAFLLVQDFHNIKTALKGVFSGKTYTHLLLGPGTVDPQRIAQAVGNKDFALLPDAMAQAAERAYRLLADTHDAQLSDGCLDAALMQAQLQAAEASGMAMLKAYFNASVFYSNAKIALRAARAGKDMAFLKLLLCPQPGVNMQTLQSAVLAGAEEVLDWLAGYVQFGGAELAEQYRQSPSLFERYVDDRLLAIAKQGRTVTLGQEPVVGFLLGKLTELRCLEIIACGIKTGRGEAEITGRLRALYD